ncbi:MAG TPA: hypothetical protein VNI54_10500 [Thermoanaerobaculia bacterium]|nr:hypothetical protein [Thermoanaerobaculia bacterium]
MADHEHLGPVRVEWADITRSRNRLREAGIGLPDLSLAEVLNEPLGPTVECLSANEVAEHIAHDLPYAPDSARAMHVTACPACLDALHVFRSINPDRRKATRIRVEATITIPTSGAQLRIKVANYGDSRVLSAMKPGSVVVESSFLRAQHGKVVEPIHPPQGATEATVIIFPHFDCRLIAGETAEEVPIRLTGETTSGEFIQGRDVTTLVMV